MTTQERATALQKFGYDGDEARFLSIAALHSGYFLRRQFLSFVGGTKGWRDVVLLNKLKANQHSRAHAYRHNRMVYHLCAKPLYAALGEKDNRNRRERQPSTIKNKLMGLDFVLENPQHQYLATEQEKLNYFLDTLKIAAAELPTRWYESPRGRGSTPKHFVDKYPLFLSGDVPVVHFGYVDEGAQSTNGFATHLDQYNSLLTTLPDFRVIYIAQKGGLFEGARRVFEEFSARRGSRRIPLDPETQQLLDYFKTRQPYEARDYSRLDTAGLIRYREAKKQFAGERYEALYQYWQGAGTAALLATLQPGSDRQTILIERFSTYVLEHDYDLFGTLTTSPQHRREPVEAQTQA